MKNKILKKIIRNQLIINKKFEDTLLLIESYMELLSGAIDENTKLRCRVRKLEQEHNINPPEDEKSECFIE